MTTAAAPATRSAVPLAIRSIAIVVVGSMLVGGLTSPAQQYLPDEFRSLANSVGGWSMFAFLLVWLSGARPRLGAVLGAVSFVLMVESYGVVTQWRGFPWTAPFTSSWDLIGLVAGPVIGGAAALVRHLTGRIVVASVGVLSLVLVAEGIFGLTVVAEWTSPVYWWIEIVLAVGFLALAAARAGILGRSRRFFIV